MKTKILSLFIAILFVNFSFSQKLKGTRNIGLDNISVIEIAGNGDAWIGSFGQGVAYYDAVNNLWVYYNSGNTPAIKNDSITGIDLQLVGGVQHAYISTLGGGVYTSGFVWDSVQQTTGLRLKGVQYRPDSLWFLSNTNILRFDSSVTTLQTLAAPFQPVTYVAGNLQCGGFWAGTGNNGCFYTSNGTTFTYIDTSMPNKKLVDNRVSAIAVDNNCGIIFVGTQGGFSSCPLIGPPCYNITTTNGLPQNQISSVTIGCGGLVWIGTRDSGVVIFNPQNQNISRLTTADGLTDNRVTTIGFYGDSCEAWVATADGNVTVMDSSKHVDAVFTSVKSVNDENFSLLVYPQPSKDKINFVSPKEISNGELSLFDFTGKKLQQNFIGDVKQFSADVAELANGIYFYQLYSDKILVKTGKVELVK